MQCIYSSRREEGKLSLSLLLCVGCNVDNDNVAGGWRRGSGGLPRRRRQLRRRPLGRRRLAIGGGSIGTN